MKRLPFILVGVACLTFAVTGCNTGKKQSGADSLSADSVNTFANMDNKDTLAVDSFGYAYANSDSTIQCTIYVDYPQGDDSLSQAVKAFIGEQLCSMYVPYSYGSDDNIEDKDNFVPIHKEYPRYQGSVLKGQKMIDYYGKGSVKFLKETMKDLKSHPGDDDDDDKISLCCNVEVRKITETPTYITYAMNTYTEMGGPHGSYTYYAMNISKLTNKPIEKCIDSTQTKAMQGILKKGIEQCYKENGETDFKISDIYSYLDPTGGKKGNQLIPLPASTPYIDKDSLCFTYQQYEIAPYSDGIISFNVALKDVLPYLRKEVKDLVVVRK